MKANVLNLYSKKLDVRLFEEKRMRMHKQKVLEMRSTGMSSSPKMFTHVYLKPKTNFLIDGELLSTFVMLCV